jgi:hypothetical protein
MSNNAYITTTDPIVFKVYTKEETELYFGEEFLEEYGVEIDPVLIRRYKKNLVDFYAIQAEIEEIVKEKSNE